MRRIVSRDGPHPVDVHVGNRARQRRTLVGLSQMAVADALDLTFQQLQKYEHGANRISSSRLYQLAQIFDVPVSFFFDEMPPELTNRSGTTEDARPSEQATDDHDKLVKRETLELVRAYFRIKDLKARAQLMSLVKAIAKS